MDDPRADPKRAAVLREAYAAFTSYGYKRTTMDDIARACGMSRPALYLLYDNKADIFRACMQAMMADMRLGIVASFRGDANVTDKVKAALFEGIVRHYRDIADTPHGAELFDIKYDFAADLFRDWVAAMEEEIAAGLENAAAHGAVDLGRSGLSAERVASLLVDGAEGMKMRMTTADDFTARLSDLVDLIIGPLST